MAAIAGLFARARDKSGPDALFQEFSAWLRMHGVSEASPAVVIIDPVGVGASRLSAVSTLCWSVEEIRAMAREFRAGVTVDMTTRSLCAAAGAIVLIFGEVPMVDPLTFAESVRILRYA